MERLPRSFYTRPTLEVARELLGKYLITKLPDGKCIAEITEVESYIGEDDPASHAAVGRTKRTEPMYGEAGHAYVYFIYGIYECFNVVTEQVNYPAAILIRGVKVIQGKELMMQRRKKTVEKGLSDGPGKLCIAMGIDRSMNTEDLVTSDTIYIVESGKYYQEIQKTTRVGITRGTEKLWRFFIKNI